MRVTIEVEAKDEEETNGETCLGMSDPILDVLSELRRLRRRGVEVIVRPFEDDPASPSLVDHLDYFSQ